MPGNHRGKEGDAPGPDCSHLPGVDRVPGDPGHGGSVAEHRTVIEQRAGARLIEGRPVRHDQSRDPESTSGGHRGEHEGRFRTGEAGHQPGYGE